MSIPVSCRINRLFENNRSGCEWKIKEEIGAGKQAIVFKVCCNNDIDCDFAVKIYGKHVNRPIPNEDLFNNEINIHYKLNELGLAVPIIEAFYCPDHGAYVIMEKRDMNVEEYILQLLNDGLPDSFIKNKIEQLRKDCISLVLTAYDNNIEQRDSNIGNFLVDRVGNDYKNICMTDFAHTRIFGNKIKPEYSREDKSIDVLQTINLLKDKYERERLKMNKPTTRFEDKINKMPENIRKMRTARSLFDDSTDRKESFAYNTDRIGKINLNDMELLEDSQNLMPKKMNLYDDMESLDNISYKSPMPKKMNFNDQMDSSITNNNYYDEMVPLDMETPMKLVNNINKYKTPIKSINKTPETPYKMPISMTRGYDINEARANKRLF
jgi:serine/threonine protein kinase